MERSARDRAATAAVETTDDDHKDCDTVDLDRCENNELFEAAESVEDPEIENLNSKLSASHKLLPRSSLASPPRLNSNTNGKGDSVVVVVTPASLQFNSETRSKAEGSSRAGSSFRGEEENKLGPVEQEEEEEGGHSSLLNISLHSLDRPLAASGENKQVSASSIPTCVSQATTRSTCMEGEDACWEDVACRSPGPPFPVHHVNIAGCTCTLRPCLFCQAVVAFRRHSRTGCQKFKVYINRFVRFLLVAALVVYLGFAFHHSFGDEPSLRLLGFTLLILGCWLVGQCGQTKPARFVQRRCAGLLKFYRAHRKTFSRLGVVAVVGGVSYFLVFEVALHRPQCLMSAVGLFVFIILFYVTSHDPAKVRWSTVGWGLVLQFLLALLVLRTGAGRAALAWLGDRFTELLAYTDYGARFVFGDNFDDHHFAFKVMPSVIFFSATMSVLYYYGILQAVVKVTAGVVTFFLDTRPWESTHAALSVFMGWAESMLVVRPVLPRMTAAELHTVMTNSFATVAGSTAAAFVQYGVPANHLFAASLMSAPASLALSKLSYPDRSCKKREKDKLSLDIQSPDTGFLEAIVSGATSAVIVVSYIVANVIAFMCILAFLNDVTFWLCQRVGLEVEKNSLQVLCSYVFWPFAFLMGVPTEECGIVGRMVGIKLLVSELLALDDLGTVHRNRGLLQRHLEANGTFAWLSSGDITLHGTNTTLQGGVLSLRSETMATFALCGFSDMYAFCVLLATLASAAPSRKQELVSLSLRAWLCGIVAGFSSACMAGLTSTD